MQTNVVLYVSSLSRSKLSREITCLQLKRTFIKITQSDNTAEKKKVIADLVQFLKNV